MKQNVINFITMIFFFCHIDNFFFVTTKYTVITIKQAEELKPTAINHQQYWKFKITKFSQLMNIWFIKTNNTKKKERVIITNDGRLLCLNTGHEISKNAKLTIRYMLKLIAHDIDGDQLKMTMFDAFNEIIKKSAAFTFKKFIKSNFSQNEIFAHYLQILNASSWIVTTQSTINKWKDVDNKNHKTLHFTIEKIEKFDSSHSLWTENDNETM